MSSEHDYLLFKVTKINEEGVRGLRLKIFYLVNLSLIFLTDNDANHVNVGGGIGWFEANLQVTLWKQFPK